MSSALPQETYLSLMQTIRGRFDIVHLLKAAPGSAYLRAETAAFHGRKIVEAVAFGCLVAVDHGLGHVPRDAKGQWKADAIFNRLRKKGLDVLPSPSVYRLATTTEQADTGAQTTIEGQPDRRLTHDELIATYGRLHKWAHEQNPYTRPSEDPSDRVAQVWSDLERLELFMSSHFISIRGAGFFTVLWDAQDGMTKVVPLAMLKPYPDDTADNSDQLTRRRSRRRT